MAYLFPLLRCRVVLPKLLLGRLFLAPRLLRNTLLCIAWRNGTLKHRIMYLPARFRLNKRYLMQCNRNQLEEKLQRNRRQTHACPPEVLALALWVMRHLGERLQRLGTYGT